MLRSAFFAGGAFISMSGFSFLFIDKLVFTKPPDDSAFRGMITETVVDKEKRNVLDPPDWAPFSLMSIGGVTMLYAVALPKLIKQAHHE